MTILPSGNIGIGVGTPGYALDVSGDVNVTGTFRMNGSALAGTGTVTSVSGSGGTTGLTLGGGPITDSGTLTLGGTLALANGGTGATTQAGAANAILPSQGGNSGKILTTDGSNVSWGTAAASSQWTTGGSDIYYSAGKVGIGTATPTAKLDVSAAGEAVRLIGDSNFLAFYNSANTVRTAYIQQNTGLNLDISTAGLPLVLNQNGGSVGIGTATPDGSALLEVNSTTKGFLPPRMTEAQRTAIATPATGLTAYQTDGAVGLYVYSGSQWMLVSGGVRYLGEEYLGGIIFYLYTGSGGVQKGLVVSKTEGLIAWGGFGALVNANKSSNGAYNMNLMPAGGGTARAWVEALGAGWYLPSVDELSLLWNHRFHINNSSASGLTLLRNDLAYGYWSSTEYDSTQALYVNALYGYVNGGSKANAGYVRGIKAF